MGGVVAYGTVLAFKHEIDAWRRSRTKFPGKISLHEAEDSPPVQPAISSYLVEHDAITRTIHRYISGARAGDGDLMRPAFHP